LVLLAACNGDGGGAGDSETDTDTTGSPTSDTSSTGEGPDTVDTSEGSSSEGSSSETGTVEQTLLELLASIEPGTRWAELSPEVQATILAHADARWAEGEADWGARGLLDKQAAVLDAPTAAIDANFDLYAIVRLSAPDGHSATASVVDAALQSALRRTYLIEIGFQRSELAFYYPAPPLDWDGESPISQYPSIFAADTHAAQRAYAADVHAALLAIDDAELDEIDATMRRRALYITRAIAAGSRSAWGADELYTPVGLVGFSADPYFIWSVAPDAFAGAESYIQHINALTQQPLQWVDIGTVTAARDYWFPSIVSAEEAGAVLGDETLGGYHAMLMDWWLERLEASAEASTPCTEYSDSDRADLMGGFAGNMSFDAADEMSLADLQPLTTTFAADLGASYRAVAIAAVDSVFADDSLLSASQRAQVHGAIAKTHEFGALVATIEGALDEATGGSAASDEFRARIDAMEVLGLDENGEVTPEMQARMDMMWTEVREHLVAQNAGFVVDYAAALPETIEVTDDYGAFASPEGITAGLGVQRTAIEWYTILLHEAHHVVNFNAGLVVEGAAIEGAANLASRAHRSDLLLAVTSPLEAALGELLLVSSDARLVGFTDATLGVLLRDDCSGPDTIAFATDIAASWGVSDDDLPLAPYRAHAGTQYLGYLMGEVLYADRLAYFSSALGVTVDAYDLQKCGMPAVEATPANADALADCLLP
jgi:hypothetical protein